MHAHFALEHRARVAEFQRRHRVGLLSLVFTDMIGSTQLKQDLGDVEAATLVRRHHELVRQTLQQFKEGEEIDVAGDSLFVVFARPSDAVRFALLVQRQGRTLTQAAGHRIADRIGIHLGEVLIVEREDASGHRDLYGIQVDTCARLMAMGEGDQILLTRAAFDSARQALRGESAVGLGELSWLNHGCYRLKGVEEPVEVCEVGEVGLARLQDPPDTEKAQRRVTPEDETVLGWRPAVGQVVPRTQWVLEQKLGEGGFGEVWRGLLPALKAERVFKFCFRADRVRSLKREVLAFRQLRERIGSHAHIIELTGLCLDEPPYYVAMEYARGGDLRDWCQACGGAGKIPLDIRLEIIAQIAEALHAAHQAGIIHRDVKPANILIAECGARNAESPELGVQNAEFEIPEAADRRPRSEFGARDARHPAPSAKLTDFGIGQVLSEEQARGATTWAPPLSTQGASQSGTQMFLAPELTAGQPASPQSDIYALGAVLMQLASGDFSQPVTTDWFAGVKDRRLRAVLKKCFAGRPQDRFATAGQMAEQLRAMARLPRVGALGRAPGEAAAGWLARLDWRVRAAMAGLAVLAAAVLLPRAWNPAIPIVRKSPTLTAGGQLLAISPFKAVGGDPNAEAIGEGLVETLAIRMTQWGRTANRWRVVPMSEIRGEKVSDARHARDLFGATRALNGSIQRAGDQFRLNLSLIDCASLHALQTTNLDFPTRPSYHVQDEVAQLVGVWIGAAATGLPPASLSADGPRVAAAYAPYLEGMGYLARYDRGENLERALLCFSNAATIDPKFALAHAALGETYWRKYEAKHETGYVAAASNACQRALHLEPNLAQAHFTLGLISTGTGESERAVMEFNDALRLNPGDSHTLRELARAYEKQGRYPQAQAALRRAIDLNPDYWAGYNALGAFHSRLGHYDAAVQCFEKVVELTPDNYRGHRNLGGVYALQGLDAEARAQLWKSLALRPTPEAWSNLGTLDFFDGDYPGAARKFERAVELGDKRPTYWGNLGDALRLSRTNSAQATLAYHQAVATAEQVLGVDPEEAETRAHLALDRLSLGETATAPNDLKLALRLAPQNVNVRFQAALFHERIGQRDQALEDLELAARDGYSHPEILRHPDLAALRADARFGKLAAVLKNHQNKN